jgi:alpha,alpha-trehalase
MARIGLLAALATVSSPAASAQSQGIVATQTPADVYGPLFEAVQLARVFPDSKTFVDLVPDAPPAAIMAAYHRERPTTRAELTAFVARYFKAASSVSSAPSMREHIRSLWPLLSRPPIVPPAGSSALALPDAWVVPGGRYQEFYYWDSYFTMLGLKADGQQPMIEAMLANFVSLIERYGHIPNGTRTYYLSRSQPPFFALMLDLSDDDDPVLARRRLAALRAEHDFWMKGRSCLGATSTCDNVVRMPDGSLLNRYWDARDTPREESYAEDRSTAAAAATRPAAQVYRDLRAAAESGWDFGSRWLADGRTLATIHTTDIVPIDLNSLLWAMEHAIARRCAASGDPCARTFQAQADARARAIARYLWDPQRQHFGDYDLRASRSTAVVSAAALMPLFVGLATPDQARATATLVRGSLLAPGGLRTTLRRTGQQWDDPNGWAPLQWIAVKGLERFGEPVLAREIAERWLRTVGDFYARTGRMIEKYDIEMRGAGGGGEYRVQDGFGWTNGVTAALLDEAAVREADTGIRRRARGD